MNRRRCPRIRLESLRTALRGASSLLMILFHMPVQVWAEDSHTEKIRQMGRLVVVGYPEQGNPFMSVDTDNPEHGIHDPERYVGIDAELVEMVARRLGVEIYYEIPKRFSITDLIKMVGQGEADMAASALTITDRRRQQVNFSRPYYSFHPVVVVPLEGTVQRFDDLFGKTAAVGRGSSQEDHLRKIGFDGDHLVLTSFSIESVEALVDGRADFILEDPDIAKVMATTNRSLRISFEFPISDSYGLAIPKGSDLKIEIDAVLEELEASGQLRALINKHLAVRGTLDTAVSQP